MQAKNPIVDAKCLNCHEPLSPMWDDWGKKLVGFTCDYCGLLFINERPVDKDWYRQGSGQVNLKVRSFR